MGQTLGKLGAFSLTLEGIGLTVSIVTFLVFELLWNWNAKKRGGKKPRCHLSPGRGYGGRAGWK